MKCEENLLVFFSASKCTWISKYI